MNQKKSYICQKLLIGGAITTLSFNPLFSPALSSSPSPQEPTLEDSPKALIDEVWQIINNEFVDRDFNNTDWIKKRQELLNGNYSNRKQAYKAIREALKELGDPYTRFLSPEEFEVLTSQTSGETSGVGVRLAIDKRTSDLIVVDTLKSSPAMEAGIQPGDRIVRINGKPTALMSLEQAVEEMKGEEGTDVSLQISRQGKGVFAVTLTRAHIEIASVSYTLKEEEQLKIGYIKLDEFSSHAAEQMKQAIEELSHKKVDGYVLDLRGNPGGLLYASVDIARMWMKQGKIVSTVDRRGGNRQFSANGTALTDLPLVVLVNQGSASASEILAGALKENGRATVIGTSTYGKATVQSVHSLSDGSGLAVTIARYYPPSGTNINKQGIKPDVEIGLTMEQQVRLQDDPTLLGTIADPQYHRAISVIKSQGFAQPAQPVKPIGIRPQ
ncbi:carboxyl-terminal protease [Gloeothece citriformis PCC 7424]|uniref:Carboxyl-terminal-processing protease n=1 Tax=Gloeothece citriformis (strain PCC 7424) TaxID=65393 RepID=B7KEP0_GLOC7|nr:carboxyl-terminal processing protease CtpB [Gloeothece citriformis]ACK69065.1 carboxyl-terminal protease [Gloeothece citriformis PCC 7424]